MELRKVDMSSVAILAQAILALAIAQAVLVESSLDSRTHEAHSPQLQTFSHFHDQELFS